MMNIKFSMKPLVIILFIISLTGLPTKSYAQGGLRTAWVASFMLMAEQMSALMIQQVEIIGTFFDAKHQLESQRLFQEKVARAHKDYHPSEQMCEIGTLSRDLSRSHERMKISRNAIQNASLARALRTGEVKSFDDQGSGSDQLTREAAFIDTFCNISDNGGELDLLCDTSKLAEQQNADLNYTQTIDAPLTLNFDITTPASAADVTLEEENIFALLDQIFMNEPFTDVARSKTLLHNFTKPYQEMRSLTAMRSVAQNSFAHIISEKSAGPEGEPNMTPYMRSLLGEMGLEGLERDFYLGSKTDEDGNVIPTEPSYYAQMELLTKKIYQNPQFIANLYDKPANVKRIRAALSAIKLMQDRDIHNAMQRREMLTSMILELQLRKKQNRLANDIEIIIANPPYIDPGLAAGAEAAEEEGAGAGF